ncbi:signal peptidase I [Hahella sp. CCB-MM4]|uniref:signal peptidase I n=1 Tax=Hahella sp. (strain CCB-MM4) TaxID=1926491 RepID=UPI000B9C252E|nr:signal peptidase I [Hahella sp. CCB-MM4]OZG70620.1 signal peptidase I [Hahella sp. CCB-MM4]
MDFDFAIILVLLTGIAGVIWLVDALFFAGARRAAASADSDATDAGEIPVAVEYAKSFFPVLLLVLVVRSFLVEPFQIPSQSMLPTLEVGDFILVNKYEYGLRVPVLGYKFFDIGSPERGDVMVFKNPEDNITNYIKRVVGVPGDVVRYTNKELYINGERVSEKLLAALPAGAPRELIFEEMLGESQHRIIKRNDHNVMGDGEWTIPEGYYFMMGDNRDRSKDSRFIGLVPDENIVGRAFAIWMHWEKMLSIPSFSRVGLLD